MDLIGLFKIAGHLGQQLVAGDADVDREAQLAADAVLEPVRGEDGWAVEALGAAISRMPATIFKIRTVFVRMLSSSSLLKLFSNSSLFLCP